ncbi:MAG: homoserine kinase [Anaerolineae bacterium]|jgi:homoserine kinase|nr:homoserine kinase [Anaerolineae bacterium]
MLHAAQPAPVCVYAPATVANLGVGFDILGMALDSPGDRVTAEFSPAPGVELLSITGDEGRLSTDPDRNTAGIAARETLRALGVSTGVRLRLVKGLPLASGLGSSAASAVAAAVAVNELYGAPLAPGALLPACVEAEAAVSGRHADNVAPALFGGIVLVTARDASGIHRLPIPDNMHLALVTPDVAVPTAQARAVLPESVPLRTLVAHTGAVAMLIHALYTNDLPLFAQAMQQDAVITPARAALIPGLGECKIAAHDCGALATIISGAGPTICALCCSSRTAEAVLKAFAQVYQALGIPCQTHSARPNPTGAAVESNRDG